MSDHHGQWQAQGDDITEPPGGHCKEWGQNAVPTKGEGLQWLVCVVGMCTSAQRRRREARAQRQAERFVSRAPREGYPTTSKHFYAQDDRYPDARIDVEVYGMAFQDDT
jgi:hypothetical protein